MNIKYNKYLSKIKYDLRNVLGIAPNGAVSRSHRDKLNKSILMRVRGSVAMSNRDFFRILFKS